MFRTLRLVCLGVAVLGGYSAFSGEVNWPQWRGPQGNGRIQDPMFQPGPDTGLEIVWKKELGSSYSSISVMNGNAVTMFSDGTRD